MSVGVAGAALSPAARADETLGPLAGSDTAIILGGTFESKPDLAFAQAAENLYLHPLGFDGGAMSSTVCDMVGTDPCAAPLQVLTTPELIQQGPSSLTDAEDITLAVENEFNANPGAFSAEDPLTVFGYSQSATAESLAMTQLHDYGIPLDDVHFVFIGDPSLEGTGVWPNLVPDLDSIFGTTLTDKILTGLGLDGVLGNLTPTDLYPTTIYTLATDGVADWQTDFESGGLLSGISHLFIQHAEYLGLTPEQIANATTSTNGNLTLVDISDNINNAEAWIGALEHGIGSSGLFESLFQSLELYLTNTF
ncbi:PE-PPE domain-containing protein [Mycobacterium cookii]|nr:PE-PPE domain-containing protein [Mycobacterium cookii]